MMDSPENEPAALQLSAMIPAARFYSREEAEAMTALAAEFGIVAPVVNAGRAMATFDMSLGAVGSADGFTVFVNPKEVEKLRTALESRIEIDPQDPLCALSIAELKDLVAAPLNANITEQIIAAKLLASRGGVDSGPSSSAPVNTGFSLDPHQTTDARIGRWLGGITLFFTVIYLWFAILATPRVREWMVEKGVQETRPAGALREGRKAAHHDAFAGGVRIPLLGVLPSAAAFALVVSRRKRADDSIRPMFAAHWRYLGWCSIALALAGWVWFVCRGFQVYAG
jgi:hypothetical protein